MFPAQNSNLREKELLLQKYGKEAFHQRSGSFFSVPRTRGYEIPLRTAHNGGKRNPGKTPSCEGKLPTGVGMLGAHPLGRLNQCVRFLRRGPSLLVQRSSPRGRGQAGQWCAQPTRGTHDHHLLRCGGSLHVPAWLSHGAQPCGQGQPRGQSRRL